MLQDQRPFIVEKMAEARSFIGRGEFARALPLLEEAHAFSPRDTDVLDSLAKTLRRRGHYTESLQRHQWAVDIDPQFGVYYVEMSKTYNEMRQHHAAWNCLLDSNQPGNLLVRTAKAETLICCREFEVPREMINAVLRENANYIPALYARAKLNFQSGKLDAAEETCRQLMQKDSERPVARGYLGVVLLLKGKTDAAMECLGRASRERPHERVTDLGLEAGTAIRRDSANAKPHLDRLLASNP